MANIFRTLSNAFNPHRIKLLDTRWLDDLPVGDYLAAQGIVRERLKGFTSSDSPLDEDALAALMAIDERSRANVATLTWQYVKAPVLAGKIDDRLWQSVYGHYHTLAAAYRAFLDRYAGKPDDCPFPGQLPQLVLNLVDCERCMAKWRYLRYQTIASGAWARLHGLYLMAERQGYATTPLQRHAGQERTTILACYLEALMLDMLNHSNLRKIEIEMVSGWLEAWCQTMTLSTEYDELNHLFYVNLDEDRGGRRLRNIHPTPSHRYWEADKAEDLLVQARQELQQGQVPGALKLLQGVDFSECLRLVEHLLAEWSRASYHRQRRTERRDVVARPVQVMHGIYSVCQQVRNATDEQRMQTYSHKSASRKMYNEPLTMSDIGGIAYTAAGGGSKWIIENESHYGLGAVVDADLNGWLAPGKIIALDDGANRGSSLVGVVRSIRQLPENKRYVGVELFAQAPGYVQLNNLEAGKYSWNTQKQPEDVFLAANLIVEGEPPFPALYLPRDGELDLPPTLLMPVLGYVPGGLFELRANYKLYQVRMGKVIEQKSDWVRVVPEPVGNQSIEGDR